MNHPTRHLIRHPIQSPPTWRSTRPTPRTSKRLVRSAALTHFVEVCTQCGLDARALVLEAGLPLACLDNPDLKIDTQAALGLLEQAAALSREPAFGLRMGETRRLSNVGPLAVAIRDEPTLRHVLDVLVRHVRLHNEAMVIRLQREGRLTLIRLELLTDEAGRWRQGIELAVVAVFRAISLFMGSQWRARAISLAHKAPRSLAVHRRIFGPIVHFEQDFNGIVCDSADLDLPNPSADPVIARYAEQFLDAIDAGQASFHDQVRELVLMLMPLGRCTAEVVAQHLGCNRRTINRRLADEGLSFHQLVELHRIDIAPRYIAAQDLTLAQIATRLGFSSRTVLSRWYSRHFGHSPRSTR